MPDRNRWVGSKRRMLKLGIVATTGGLGVFAGVVGWASAQIALPEAVETAPLAKDAFSTGTLDRTDGALGPDLWRGADAETLEFLLLHAPARPSTPAIGEALRRTLLSPGTSPEGAAPSLGGKKLLALSRAGFLNEANTVAALSNAGRGDPWTGQALAISDLLKNDIARACQRNAGLTSGRDELFWVKLRVLCYAEAGERDAADLTLNILREQGALSADEELYLTAVATGAKPKSPPAPQSVLQYAISRKLALPLAPDLLSKADGGVLVAIVRDSELDLATRIAAATHAAAMGVVGAAELKSVFDAASFDLAAIGEAATALRERPRDPITDALLYQSVKAMSAPEFLRDKAARVSDALGLADSFPRAYALSLIYADEISSLEGAIVSAVEAERFAVARMAVGDAVGAGQWLLAMLGGANNVSALPEPQALSFINLVNLLTVLDPQTASQVARAAGVSLLNAEPVHTTGSADGAADPETTARILEAAFDAAIDDKAGQAGLAAIAAASIAGAGEANLGDINNVVVNQSFRVAGLADLRRRHQFEKTWGASFAPAAAPLLTPASADAAAAPLAPADEDEAIIRTAEDGPMPRLKPAVKR